MYTKNTWRVGRLPDGSGVLLWPMHPIIEVAFENHPNWAGEYADQEHYVSESQWVEYLAVFERIRISWLPEGDESLRFVENHFPNSRISQGEDVDALFETSMRRYKKYLDERSKSDRIKSWLHSCFRLSRKSNSE